MILRDLQDRLEAANALKKQMWAEAQLDKSRLKEENITKLDFTPAMGSKAETHLASSAAEGGQSPLPVFVDNKNEASPSLAEDKKPMFGSQVFQNHLSEFPNERTVAVQDPSTGLDNLATQQHGYASKRSRSQLKAYIAHMAEEMYVYRSLPLGQDRRRNRYWQFATSASRNDPCSGRIFVELHDGTWRLIDTVEVIFVQICNCNFPTRCYIKLLLTICSYNDFVACMFLSICFMYFVIVCLYTCSTLLTI